MNTRVNFYVKELFATYCRLSAVCSVLLGGGAVKVGVGWKSKGKTVILWQPCSTPKPKHAIVPCNGMDPCMNLHAV